MSHNKQTLKVRFAIQDLPSIKYFGLVKDKPEDYKGELNFSTLYKFMERKFKSYADELKAQEKSEDTAEHEHLNFTDIEVIELTVSNFDENVLNSKHIWFVEFYAPWCRPCKDLEKEWNRAAHDLRGKVKLAKVNGNMYKELVERYGVKGYPTIKVFNPRSITPEAFNGPKEASAIKQVAMAKMEKYGIKGTLEQLVSEKYLETNCKKIAKICVIAVLPNINETTVSERNKNIETILDAVRYIHSSLFNYMWVQGGDYPDLEQKLGLTFGYPAVVAVSFVKRKFKIMRTSYTLDNVQEFMKSLMYERRDLETMPNILSLNDVNEWDGKEATLEL